MQRRTASDVANYFIRRVDGATHLKLQKLCYYAQGYSIRMHGEPIFSDKIEAWQHGPVVRSLYRRLRGSASKVIHQASVRREDFSDEELAVLRAVVTAHGHKSGWELREETHQENPWRACYGRADPTISIGLIADWFEGLHPLNGTPTEV